MIEIYPSQTRGTSHIGWLDARHSFSFGNFYDPERMGYRVLRVLNDDRIAPGGGFPMHPHRDMEIVSVVVEGELTHRDSLGNGSVIRPGDVQRMSAGQGIVHSEFNASEASPLRLLQIWMQPGERGLEPGYEQRHFPKEERRGRLRLVVSPDGAEGSVKVHQDARLYSALLDEGQSVTHTPGQGRGTWIQIVRGAVSLGDHTLSEGDGATLQDESSPATLTALEDAEVLVFDLP